MNEWTSIEDRLKLLSNIKSVYAEYAEEQISAETAMTFIGMYIAELAPSSAPSLEK